MNAVHIKRHPTPSAVDQEPIEITARHRLRPYPQGDLDGLCGLYGAVNAIRLALAEHAPLTKARSKALFAEGVDFLHRKKGLDSAMVIGMGTKRRLALARHLASFVSTTNCLTIERPDYSNWASSEDALRWVDESLADGKPVLVAIMGGELDHFTVIAGSTPATWALFDSTGLRFIRKSSVRSGHYRIPPNGLLRIAVERSD